MAIYYLPSGEVTRHPPTVEEANSVRDPLYDPGEWCDNCKLTRYRYAYNDKCMHCARLEAIAFFNIMVGAEPLDGQSESVRALWLRYGADAQSGKYGLKPKACSRAGHIGLISGTRCELCARERASGEMEGTPRDTENNVLMRDCPELVLDRETARGMGYGVYRTGEACKRGHEAYRYVASRNCVECAREARATPI